MSIRKLMYLLIDDDIGKGILDKKWKSLAELGFVDLDTVFPCVMSDPPPHPGLGASRRPRSIGHAVCQ